MGKRAHGTGSIYQLPSGKWRVQVTVDGKRISHTSRTKKAADDWARKIGRQVERGLTYKSTQTHVAEFLDSWLDVKASKLRPATMEQYHRIVRLHIKPYIGDVIIRDLNAARIQRLYDELQKNEVGKRTIEIAHTILHGCLKHGLRLGLVSQNWASLVEVPRPNKREMKVWDESQVSQFLITVPAKEQVFYRMAFATGMRRGELIGLQWKDLDLNSETIRVRRQVYRPRGGGFRFQEPKTARGRRLIRLGPGLIASLRNHFNHDLPMMRAIADDKWQEHDLIFPSTIGTPKRGYQVSKEFTRAAKAAGLPHIRFHDIRHTAASIMLLHREPPVRVAGILGQSLAVLMNTYAHYIPDDQERVSMLMDEITSPIQVDFSDNCTRIAHETERETI